MVRSFRPDPIDNAFRIQVIGSGLLFFWVGRTSIIADTVDDTGGTDVD